MLNDELWQIEIRDDGDVLAVVASGELDMATSGQLTTAFAAANGHTALVCDLTGLTFIDSSGLQALLALQRDERFALAGTSECVERLLDLAGVARMFRRITLNPGVARGAHGYGNEVMGAPATHRPALRGR